MKGFCGEISYYDEKGRGVSSDICWHNRSAEFPDLTDEFRQLLHAALDEWLDKAMGEGVFWVGDRSFLFDNRAE